jgi:crotonobetainyl-CoA:carnitine CoA-transferase CaiB-like acyl-CoA transferase
MADPTSNSAPRCLPLAGLRVLDLSRILAGPVCTQLLADLGADVVKLERPGTGDDTRHWGPPFVEPAGTSAYFLSCNRGKRSLAVELGQPAAGPLLEALVARADVLVENFLPEQVARFGLQPERLSQLNPGLVSCSISAFGRNSPLADTPGYDLAIQAMAGLMSITGEPAGQPMKVGVAISDVLTGLYAAVSILAGLHARRSVPAGMHFDLALADCTLASLVNVAQSTLITGRPPVRYGNAHPQIVPYEVFAVADGHLVLAIGADRQWQRFCRATDRQAWAADPRFATNPQRVAHRQALHDLLAALLAQRTLGEWSPLLAAAEVPHARVVPLDAALESDWARYRGMTRELTDRAGRRYRVLGSPIHWHQQPELPATAPPDLGEHTDDVLRDWLKYNAAQLAELRAQGVIA